MQTNVHSFENRKERKQAIYSLFLHPVLTRGMKANMFYCMPGDSRGVDAVPTGQHLQEGEGAQHPLPAKASPLTCCRLGSAPAPVRPQRREQAHPLRCFQP